MLFDVQELLHCGFGEAVAVAVAVADDVDVAVAVAQRQFVLVVQVAFLQFPPVDPLGI